MSKLTGTTIVTNPVTYLPEVLLAGSDLPDWAAGQVGTHLLDVESEPVTAPAPEAVPAEMVPSEDGVPVLQPVTEPEQPEPVTAPAAKRAGRSNS